MIKESLVPFSIQAPYYSLGTLQSKTKSIWMVFHGYGQLAKHFVRRFDVLPKEEHFVIAPQGLSQFYLDEQYDKIGASWLTREHKELAIQNQMEYLVHVLKQAVPENYQSLPINIMGFSQGVSTACRFLLKALITQPGKVILWAGMPPDEFNLEQVNIKSGQLSFVIGKKDPFYKASKADQLKDSFSKKFGNDAKWIEFDGGHEVKREVLRNLV